MHPELFSIGDFTIRTYGFMIMMGALLGFIYGVRVFKKDLSVPLDKVQNLTLLLIVAAVVGGKIFFYLEDPGFYFQSFENLKKDLSTGFVFYGSLIFAIPTMMLYFRHAGIPLWAGMDRMAIVACIIHGMGRMGCFFAGCCYGIPTDSALGVTFTHELSKAPIDTPLHPTQLYSGTLIFLILVVLLKLKKHVQFDGQLWFLYIILYATGRGIIEIFRGDEARGYIIDGVLSHSQFISIFIIGIAVWAYFRVKKNAELKGKS